MKIEKISDTQIKFILSQADLMERDIKITELAHSSDKAQQLFREMLEQASEELGFQIENSPLMIEAIPVSLECIMIIVSKIQTNNTLDDKLSPFKTSKLKFKFADSPVSSQKRFDEITIYSFKSLDDAAGLSSRIYGYYNGVSSLYKSEGKYFMVLQNYAGSDCLDSNELESLLNEYGEKHVSNSIAKSYLIEHGELLVYSNAVSVLAENLV